VRERHPGRHTADGCRCCHRHQVHAAAHSGASPFPVRPAAVAAGQMHVVDQGPSRGPTDGRATTRSAGPAPTGDRDGAPAAVPSLASPAIPARALPRGVPSRRQRCGDRSRRRGHCPQARTSSVRSCVGQWQPPSRTRPPRARNQPSSWEHRQAPATAQFQTSGALAPRGLRGLRAGARNHSRRKGLEN
jgi:hypothetical protein